MLEVGRMGSQQFCLRWNNHQTNMLNVFDYLLQNESLVDVTLACEGISLRAHKVVLSACSPYFQALFIENPCKHPIVILRDIPYFELKALIEFMYKGEVNVSQDKLPSLLKTAEHLKVKGLSEVAPNQSSEPETEMAPTDKLSILAKDSPQQMTQSPPLPPTPRTDSPVAKRKKARHHHKSSEGISSTSDNEDTESLNMKGSLEIVESQVDLPQNLSDEGAEPPENMEVQVKIYSPSPAEEKEDGPQPSPPLQEEDMADMPYSTQDSGMMASLPSASQYNQDSTPPSRRSLAYAPQHCRLCHKVISNIYNFRKHMRVHSPVQQRFECFLCLRVYNREDNLRWHLRTKHGVQLCRKPRRSATDLQSSQATTIARPPAPPPLLDTLPTLGPGPIIQSQASPLLRMTTPLQLQIPSSRPPPLSPILPLPTMSSRSPHQPPPLQYVMAPDRHE